ncbi:MAG: transposase [Armatimonadota bacterium]|nr:transposase [Armatimonadota bacterium]
MSYEPETPDEPEILDEVQTPEIPAHLGTLFLHVRWQTRHDKPLLAHEDVAQAAQTAIVTRARELRCRTLAVGFRPDHLHVVFAFPASLPINRLAMTAMDAAARAIARALAMAGETHIAESAVWDRHFGLHTVGPETVTEAVSYVSCQAEHHAKGTLRTQWETPSHTRPAKERRPPPPMATE